MSELTPSFENLARFYSKNPEIRLVIGGEGFATEGNVIILPNIPKKMANFIQNPTLAGLVHESMHITNSFDAEANYTSKKIGISTPQRTLSETEKIRLENATRNPAHKGLFNDIEDIRMLNLSKSLYAGTMSLQKTGLDYLRPKLEEETTKENMDGLTMLGITMLYLESELEPPNFPAEARIAAEITRDIWHDVKWKSGEDGFWQAVSVLEKIMDRIENMVSPSEKRKEKDKDQEDQEQEGEGKDQEQEGEEQEQEDQEQEGEGKDQEKIKNFLNKKPSPSSHLPMEQINPEDLFEMLKKEIENILGMAAEETKDEKIYEDPKMLSLDLEIVWKDITAYKNKFIHEKIIEDILDLESQTSMETRKLKARIIPLLLSKLNKPIALEQDSGIIDDGQLYKVFHGNNKIYKKVEPTQGYNTAISILNDCSGSMYATGKMNALKKTLLVISDTLFSIKIPFEILTFTTYDTGDLCNERRLNGDLISGQIPLFINEEKIISQDFSEKVKTIIDSIYNESYKSKHTAIRYDPLLLSVIKSFNQNYLTRRSLISMMEPLGENYDHASVEWAAKRLEKRKEQRKILFVISDGYPAIKGVQTKTLEKYLKETVIKIEKSEIEVYGIGVMTDAVKKFYKNNITIKETEEISTKILTLLSKTLREKSF